MKVVILAGGWPSSINEDLEGIPKPMVELGGRPLLWHIMKQYSYYGYNDFIICAGYKSKMIKEYFMNYYIYESDITVNLQTNQVEIHKKRTEDWNVSIIDTGLYTSVSERILKIREYVKNEAFFINYGDCISNINIKELEKHHRLEKKMLTVAAAKPAGRHSLLKLDKDDNSQSWVNACTMLCESDIFSYLDKRESYLENGLFERLNQKNEIALYKHEGFWTLVETKRDKNNLQQMWDDNEAPWKIWS